MTNTCTSHKCDLTGTAFASTPQLDDAFRQAHNDLKMVVPQKHWGSLTTEFRDLGGVSPVVAFMRGGRNVLETIKHMFPEQNVGG